MTLFPLRDWDAMRMGGGHPPIMPSINGFLDDVAGIYLRHRLSSRWGWEATSTSSEFESRRLLDSVLRRGYALLGRAAAGLSLEDLVADGSLPLATLARAKLEYDWEREGAVDGCRAPSRPSPRGCLCTQRG